MQNFHLPPILPIFWGLQGLEATSSCTILYLGQNLQCPECPTSVCRVSCLSLQSASLRSAECPTLVCRVTCLGLQSALSQSAECLALVCRAKTNNSEKLIVRHFVGARDPTGPSPSNSGAGDVLYQDAKLSSSTHTPHFSGSSKTRGYSPPARSYI